jgi:hypothetical protein
MHSKKSAISLSLELLLLLLLLPLLANQSPLAIRIRVWHSVRPMHLFDRNLDHDS